MRTPQAGAASRASARSREGRRYSAEAGLTLLEVLLVITVLSVVMLPLAGLYTRGASQASQSVFLLNAHDHLLGRLRERENRLHTHRFRLASEDAFQERSLTTRWAGVPVEAKETISVEAVAGVPGLFALEARLAWTESRGRVRRERSHVLRHLLCDPSTGQEGGA